MLNYYENDNEKEMIKLKHRPRRRHRQKCTRRKKLFRYDDVYLC